MGRFLRADAAARQAYASLREDRRSGHRCTGPRRGARAYDALVLPGGHRARGMRGYLESPEVQQMAVDSFRAGKPVGAICHGVLVAARAIDPATGRSVLHGRAHDGAHLGAGAQGLGPRDVHALLGRQLLPDLYRRARPAVRLHVRPAGGDAGPGRAVRLRGRAPRRTGLPAQDERARPGLADRCPAGLGGARRVVRLGALAG